MKNKRSYLPYVVMAAAAAMYVIKWLAKLTVGEWVNSPALIADGYHNLADLIEVGLVIIFGVYLGGRPKSEKYPMGLKRIESILVLGIGIALLILAFETITESVSGLVSLWPALDNSLRPHLPAWLCPPVKQQLLTKEAFLGVFFAAGASFVMSFFIGRYEIACGRKSGAMSMVADGEETLSDARLEAASVIGFSCKFGLIFTFGKNHPAAATIAGSCIEYALGLAVATMILFTAAELFRNALHVLLAHAIHPEKIREIKRIAGRVEGVSAITRMVTFSDGTAITCLLEIETRADTRAYGPLTRTLQKRIEKYLVSSGDCLGAEIRATFVRPVFRLYRQAQAMIIRGEDVEMVSPDLLRATHIRIYDTDGFGRRERAVNIPLEGMTMAERVGKLVYKGIKELLVFCGNDEERHAVEAAGIVYGLNFTLSPYVPPGELQL